MKNKLSFLAGISLKRKIKTKWFLFANIILCIVIMGFINIDTIINFFGGNFNDKYKIYVIDNTNRSYDLFNDKIDEFSTLLKQENRYEVINYLDDVDSVKKLVNDDKNIALVIDEDSSNTLKTTLITKDFIDTIEYQLISNAINEVKVALAINDSNINPNELEKIYSNIEIERVYLDKDKKTDDEYAEMIITTIFPIIILPIFMLTIFLVQMIGSEVNDEKSTRGMEIIISNVSPATHFFSKVIAGNLFILIQGLLFVIYALIGLFIRKITSTNNLMDELSSKLDINLSSVIQNCLGDQAILVISVILILMLLTFFAYSLLAGVLASMTTNTEDFQQIQTPIMVISLIGFYLAMSAPLFEGSIFIKVISYIPLISAILSPSLLILGQIGIPSILFSILLVVILIYILIKYGLRVYKVGILNYSSKGLWKKMFKALKKQF